VTDGLATDRGSQIGDRLRAGTARGKDQVERSDLSRITLRSNPEQSPMTKYLVVAAFALIASLAAYGVSVAPAAAAFDAYDHSFDSANVLRDGEVEAGY
jgi:hypothetical protein